MSAGPAVDVEAGTLAGAGRFHALAAGHRIVPVWRELVADTVTPVSVYRQMVGEADTGFLLE